jgi:hypothetical protein
MREPRFDFDGWTLEDGEERHARSPETFEIPPLWVRQALEPGDFAKLIFNIAVDDGEDREVIERMWVIVRTRTADGYTGILDNEPATIAENGSLRFGTELPFSARHVIDVSKGNPASKAMAARQRRA